MIDITDDNTPMIMFVCDKKMIQVALPYRCIALTRKTITFSRANTYKGK